MTSKVLLVLSGPAHSQPPHSLLPEKGRENGNSIEPFVDVRVRQAERWREIGSQRHDPSTLRYKMIVTILISDDLWRSNSYLISMGIESEA